MLDGKNKELQEIIKLGNEGKIKEALEKLEEFEKKEQQNVLLIRAKIIKALFTASMGFWEKGLVIIKTITSESEVLNDKLLLIDTHIIEARCLLLGQQYKKSITQVEETENKFEEILNQDEYDFRIRKSWLFFIKGACLSWMGKAKLALETAKSGYSLIQSFNDIQMQLYYYRLFGLCEFQSDAFEDAIDHYQAGFQLAKDTKSEIWKASFASNLAQSYRGIGRFTLAMKYTDISIEYFKKLGIPHDWMVYFKAMIYRQSGEPEKAIAIFKKILPKLEHETTHKEKALVLLGKAIIEWVEGDIDTAVEQMTEAVNLSKQMDDAYGVNIFSLFLVNALFDKGEFDKVIETSHSVLEMFKYNKNVVSEPFFLIEMGKAYHMKGNYNLALEYVNKSLELFRRFNAELNIARSLFRLIQISIDKNDEPLYIKYQKELEAFVKLHPTNHFELMNQTAHALVLKNSTRPRDWMKAVDILIKVVEEEFTRFGFHIIALINLCELLMNEFSMSGDIQVLEELEHYLGELTDLAKKQNVYHLRLEANNLQILTHWLKAQKSMVDLDFEKAKILLVETQKIADEKGLYRLAEKLTMRTEKQLKQLSEWDDFIRKYYEFIKK
ncbi:MAG: hypothetical protein HGN29_17060 [Asgard group archaeon]|nr:hypothetical protein [Asgard group archaeon]